MPDWMDLKDAYGSAASIPGLLAAAAREDDLEADVWSELWSRLCHQGTVCTASFEALPELAKMATASRPSPSVPALFLAAGIVASNDPPRDTGVRQRFRSEIAALRDVAERNLLPSTGFADFVYSLQNLAAFENLGVWQRHLESLADGELEIECSSCRAHVYVMLEPPDFVATIDPHDADTPRTPILPATTGHLDSIGMRLVSLAGDHRQPQVVLGLLHQLGHVECPSCGAASLIEDHLA